MLTRYRFTWYLSDDQDRRQTLTMTYQHMGEEDIELNLTMIMVTTSIGQPVLMSLVT